MNVRLFAFAVLVLAALSQQSASPATVTRGPYLQKGTPTNVVVRWRTDVETDTRVRVGTDPSNFPRIIDRSTLTTEHSVNVTGLSPNTRYYYSIGTTEGKLGSGAGYFFVTSPTTPKPTRIWVLGDSGTAGIYAAAVRDAYYSFAGQRHTDLWLMLGDNAYGTGTDTEYQWAVFEMYPDMLRKSVLWPTIGNHDTYSNPGNPPYLSIFTLPANGEAGGVASGTERYYSFDYGNIHFVCLDSMNDDLSSTGPMATWLQQDLNANTKPWLIAFWHHPPYSRGSHDSDWEYELIAMRQNFLPILEAYGVDLVMCGHSHSYERSFLMHGHYGPSQELDGDHPFFVDASSGREYDTGPYLKDPDEPSIGTVYAVAGSSGQASGGTLDHPAMFISLNELGSLVLDVNSNRLDATFLQADGGQTDTFTILKGTRDDVFRITSLRRTPAFVTISWNSIPLEEYYVVFSSRLDSPTWTAVSGIIPAQGRRTSWTGFNATSSQGFYRIVRVEN
jgi:acid phosphatase type 7